MKRTFFTPRWMITTLLVVAAVLVMVRLGIWQLDRLAERRAFNTRVEAQINAEPLDLNQAVSADELAGMEYRTVVVRGTYDFEQEVLLRNQVYNNLPGYHLLAPLRIAGSDQSVLVDRGFVPLNEDLKPVDLAQYAQPGEVTVQGLLRLPHIPKFFGMPDPTLAPGQSRLEAWNAINLPRIQAQIPYALLSVYIEAAPSPSAQTVGAAVSFPISEAKQPELNEGSHLGYAIQWFSFAAILALGYPYFVRRELASGNRTLATKK